MYGLGLGLCFSNERYECNVICMHAVYVQKVLRVSGACVCVRRYVAASFLTCSGQKVLYSTTPATAATIPASVPSLFYRKTEFSKLSKLYSKLAMNSFFILLCSVVHSTVQCTVFVCV
jgi:hypothetical protein